MYFIFNNIYWRKRAHLLQSCWTLCDPMDCKKPGSFPWDFPSKNTGVACHALLQGSSPSSNATRVSCVCCVAGGFFTAELWGKSKGTIWMSISIHSYHGRSDQYKLFCVCCVSPRSNTRDTVSVTSILALSLRFILHVFSAQINGSFKQLFFLRWHDEALLFVCTGDGAQYDGAFLPYSSVLLLHVQCPTPPSGVNSPAPDIYSICTFCSSQNLCAIPILWTASSDTSEGRFLTSSIGAAPEGLLCHSVKWKSLSHVQLFVTPWTI